MLLTRLLNACHHFRGFVYQGARLCEASNTIEIDVRPRRGSRPSEVVFPLASAPDDPGPDLGDAAARSRGGFLQ